jgi:hypothetical protein
LSKIFRLPILLAALAASLAICASAQAAIVTVGSPLSAAFTSTEAGISAATSVNLQLPESGAHLTSPINGTIVGWHLLDASGGPFRLRVVHPLVPGTVMATATSAALIPSNLGLQTASTNLPIKAGDFIGLDTASSSDHIGVSSAVGSTVGIWAPPLQEGLERSISLEIPSELAFNAEVQPPPTLTGLGTTSGSTSGGTAVTISGTDFEGATAVRFGAAAASGFTINSEGQITATAPAAAAGPVNVSVTTPAGVATSSQLFTYTPLTPAPTCIVPKLKGKKLKAAKKDVRRADCKLGKVKKLKGATAKTGKVVKQSPKAGKVLPAGSKVAVKLGG